MLNWKLIEKEVPEVGEIIIIARVGEHENWNKWLIGQFLETDDKAQFGILVDREKYLKPEKFMYWCSLYESNYRLPSEFSADELPRYLVVYKKLVSSYEQKFLAMAKLTKLVGGMVYPLDLYFDGIYNRSLSLMDATLTLMDSKNFHAAAHMVRLHLDSFLRLNAAWLVENPHEFAREVMSGKQINTMIDREKKLMRDGYLVGQASKMYPWVGRVYKKACDYIHFSNAHIFSGQKIINSNEGILGTHIRKSDSDSITDIDRIELLDIMIKISDYILELAYGWARTKMKNDNPDTLSQ